MRLTSFLGRAIAAGLALVLLYDVATAQNAAPPNAAASYDGKTVNIVIGSAPGSELDSYARLVARYLGRHLQGNPAIATANYAETAGRFVTGKILAAGLKDALVVGVAPSAAVAAPLWLGAGNLPYDPTRLIYLGSAAYENTDCFVSGDSPVESMHDALAGPVTMGALADRGPTRYGPVLLNTMLGTKFRVVAKYASVGAILDAIRRGEVTGACGLTWSSVAIHHADWLPKGVLRGLVQESATGTALATRLGIPLAVDLAASAQDREVMRLAYTQQALRQVFFMRPETMPVRTANFRKAFAATLADKEFLVEARAASLPVAPLSGPAVEKIVAELRAAPMLAVDRLRVAINGEAAR